MALEGELSGLYGAECQCGEALELEVLISGAGYYLGYFCKRCGPWSRESIYFDNREEAEEALNATRRFPCLFAFFTFLRN